MLSALSELLQLFKNQIIIFNQILKTLVENGDGKFWEPVIPGSGHTTVLQKDKRVPPQKAVNNEAKGKTITGFEMFMLAYSFDQFM